MRAGNEKNTENTLDTVGKRPYLGPSSVPQFYLKLTRIFMLLGYPAIAVGACLIFFSFNQLSWTRSSLRYLGKISYGLYAFHVLGYTRPISSPQKRT